MSLGLNEAPDSSATGRAYAFLVFTMLCWGANAIFGKLAVGEISPMALVAGRWVGVTLILLVVARRNLRRDWAVLRPRLPFLALMGLLGFTTFNALFYLSAYYTTALNIGILQGSIPIFVMLGAFLAFRTRVTMLQMVGVAVTMTGVVIVVSGGDVARLAALAINFGDLLMVTACALYAIYTVALRKRPQVSALSLFAVMAAAAFAASLPLLAAEAVAGNLYWPTPKAWLITAAVALFPSFLAQIAFIQGVTLIGPGRAGVFVNLVPVFAAVMAVVFLGEAFEIFHAIALALVLGGIWLSERGKTG